MIKDGVYLGIGQKALDAVSQKYYVAWCSCGCEPCVFSTRELAEKFVAVDENNHFDISELVVDAESVENKK